MSLSSDDEDQVLSDNQSISAESSDGEELPPRPLHHNYFAPLSTVAHRPLYRPRHDDFEPVPRASPQVPTYEYYGFVLYLFSTLTFLVYLLWSYLPSPFLHALGIYYYPNRWWSLAIPAFLTMLGVYIYIALAAYNTEILTLPLNSIETVVDDASKVGVIDSKGRLRDGPKRRSRDKRDNRLPMGGYNWKNIWNEGTDAVMDIPLAGACEVLYGEGRAFESEDEYIVT
ncbi:GPI-c transferase subunit p [Colletotrichum higginsianum]|nr:GPI-c transferase subunit p [Colletotrichum higginsianum]